MRQLLLELAMTSNGRTGSYAGSSAGGEHAAVIPTLGMFDAPHLHFAAKWNRATDDLERARIFDQAQEVLTAIRRSTGVVHLKAETAEEKRTRIVQYGVGLEPYDVGVAAGCTPTFVRDARARADCDEEKGYPNRDGKKMRPAERLAAVAELRGDGLSGRQIARHLRISYSTIARDLGWKT